MAAQTENQSLLRILDDHHGCPICTEICFETTSTNCGHKFCKQCIEKWRLEKPTCPMCSTEITSTFRLYSDDQFIEALLANFPPEVTAKYKLDERKENSSVDTTAETRSVDEMESSFKLSWEVTKDMYRSPQRPKMETLIDLELAPSQERICATESRFCLGHPVILSFQREDFTIRSAATGTTYFTGERRDPAWILQKKKVLRDSNGVPVVNIKRETSRMFHIYAGDKPQQMLFKCQANVNLFKRKFIAEFKDVLTGMLRAVVIKIIPGDMMCLVYLGEPKHGGAPVAKIYRPLSGMVKNYHLEIAARVDIALVTILCIALHEFAKG